MTLQEIDELLDDTRRSPRAGDRVTHAMAMGVLEIARQLMIMNQAAAKPVAGNGSGNGKAKAAKKR